MKKLNFINTLFFLYVLTSGVLFASDITEAKNMIDNNNKVESGTYTGESGNSFVTTKDGTTLEGKVKFDIKDIGGESHLELAGKGVNADDLSITITPKEDATHTRSKGLIIRGDSDVNVKNLNVDVTFKDSTGQFSVSADSNATYGVAVGYAHNGGSKTDTSKLTVNNMDVKVQNTPDTKISDRHVGSGFISAVVHFGHQLSGLKLYRTGGAKAEFISNGNVNIEVKDLSTTKIGDYMVGVYISGNESKATFNRDTNIKIVANGKNSAAIKIGKPFENITGEGPTVTANGKLTIDTTEAKDSAAVRLFNNKAKFEITGENTEEASLINSGNTAISYDITDYRLYFKSIIGTLDVSRNSNAENQEVKLKNTVIKTTSETATLIEVKAADIKDSSFGMASRFTDQLNSGAFSVNNAKFELSGEKSVATAANNGWLIETQGVNKNTVSSLTATIKDKASIYGMVNKAYGKDFDARLDMNLESGAKWVLKNKGDVNESTFNNLNIGENSILDASQINLNAGAYSNIPIPENLTENLEKANKYVEKLKRYKLDPTPENLERMKQAEEAIEQAKKSIEEYKKNTQDPKKVASPRAEYVLNSKSLDNKSSIINSGTITMNNGKYYDTLTINGNYEGKNGKLLVNTLWNTPGTKDESGNNSETDLLEIKGKASGTTEIITVNSNGEEKILDGSIGELEDKLAVSKPVVRVDNDTTGGTAFTGKVKSDSAADIELDHREKDGKTEYFWKVTKIAEAVGKYLAIPETIYETGYATLGTLNERKGNFVNISKDTQMWARIYERYLGQTGKVRTKYDSLLMGVSVGVEKIKENNHTGIYLSYTGNRAEMNTKRTLKPKATDEYKYDGMINSYGLSLGLTHTRYRDDGAYVDLVGQVTYNMHNIYNTSNVYAANTRGWGLVLSAEAGKPYYFKENKHILEPQAQIIYQVNETFGVNIDNKKVTFDTKHGLRGRVGVRVMDTKQNYYGLANLWVDLTNNTSINVGKDKLQDSYDEMWLELGLGGQREVKKDTYLYADARLEIGFNRFGVKGNIGIKKSW